MRNEITNYLWISCTNFEQNASHLQGVLIEKFQFHKILQILAYKIKALNIPYIRWTFFPFLMKFE